MSLIQVNKSRAYREKARSVFQQMETLQMASFMADSYGGGKCRRQGKVITQRETNEKVKNAVDLAVSDGGSSFGHRMHFPQPVG